MVAMDGPQLPAEQTPWTSHTFYRHRRNAEIDDRRQQTYQQPPQPAPLLAGHGCIRYAPSSMRSAATFEGPADG
jgi:hypothetical protein